MAWDFSWIGSAGSYTWNFGDGSSDSLAITYHIYPHKYTASTYPVTFTIDVDNICDSVFHDSILIEIDRPPIFIPNTITTNSDGVNDTWLIDEALSFPQIEIEIFDRWGTLVWRSALGYPVPWDGRNLDGREVPVDSYYYVIHLNDGSDPINGTITVVR